MSPPSICSDCCGPKELREREIILLSVSCAGSFPFWQVPGLAEEWWRRSAFEFTCISPHFHRLCWSPGCCSITLERMTSICFPVSALTPICISTVFFRWLSGRPNTDWQFHSQGRAYLQGQVWISACFSFPLLVGQLGTSEQRSLDK